MWQQNRCDIWNLWKKEIQINTLHGTLGCKITKLKTSLTDSLKLRMMSRQLVSLLEHDLVLKNCWYWVQRQSRRRQIMMRHYWENCVHSQTLINAQLKDSLFQLSVRTQRAGSLFCIHNLIAYSKILNNLFCSSR